MSITACLLESLNSNSKIQRTHKERQVASLSFSIRQPWSFPINTLNYNFLSNPRNWHQFLAECGCALLLGQSEPNAVGAKIVHGIPFPQKGVTKDCQWANRLRKVCEIHVNSILWTEDQVYLPMPKKDEMQEP